MWATMGYIAPEYFKWPGYLSPSSGLKFADVPNGLAALTKVPAVGWQQVVFFGWAMELFAAYQNPKLLPGKLSSRLVVGLTEVKDFANNYEFGPFGIPNAESIKDPVLRKKKLNAEIANGRLAMMAIIGMFFQDGLTGSAWGDWSLYEASPLRAFENETGVQAPGHGSTSQDGRVGGLLLDGQVPSMGGLGVDPVRVLHRLVVLPPQAQLLDKALAVRDTDVDGGRGCSAHGW